MVGIYFSGTGNTKYCVEKFVQEYDPAAEAYSIEQENAVRQLCGQGEIVMGYPVQFSSIPKILQDFIAEHPNIWNGKRIFVIATMGLFSGDGAGVLARLLAGYGAVITGGLHLKMPDSISDEKVLKRSPAKNRQLVAKAGQKIETAVQALKNGHPPREGLSFASHFAGLFGQRLYFRSKTSRYSDRLSIDRARCVGCGTCISVCPIKNLSPGRERPVPGDRCTMCYRCVSLCPAQAITLLGKTVYEQSRIEKYL